MADNVSHYREEGDMCGGRRIDVYALNCNQYKATGNLYDKEEKSYNSSLNSSLFYPIEVMIVMLCLLSSKLLY